MATDTDIDDSLYSRQRYVLGDSAMQRMAKSNVLLVNVGGLGVEIAKNITLAGVKSLTIQDGENATYVDLGCQFFIREEDVKQGRNRGEVSVPRIAELNPYVSLKLQPGALDESSDLTYLKQFQCIILTETSLAVQLRVNEFCRQQSPNITFITGDVYGVFCWTFCDFGQSFEVVDPNGEEPKQTFISNITKDNPGLVTTLDDFFHGFETDDLVSFRELNGMESLYEQQCQIKVKSPTSFTICDTSGDQFTDYQYGGIATQVKQPKVVTFSSLRDQLSSPSLSMPDLSKFTAAPNMHIGMLALHRFMETQKQLPRVWSAEDADLFMKIAIEENSKLSDKVEELDSTLLRHLSYTCRGSLAPLCTAMGGVVAQEVLKALTGKFTPLRQWLHIDATEVLSDDLPLNTYQPTQSRYDALRICVGQALCQKLAELKLFMVGCGAIGCEMMKNYAVLGVATAHKGKITITDNDLIEKSNLNRQFLFRPHHIRKKKKVPTATLR